MRQPKFITKTWLLVMAVGAVGLIFLTEPKKTEALNPQHQCSNCHNLHSAKGNQLLAELEAETTCLTCHGPGGPATAKAANHAGYTCVNCHNPHEGETNWLGGQNIKMMRAYVEGDDGTSRPVVFESRGTSLGEPKLHSFCDGDQDGNGVWDGVCDTCHYSGSNTPKKHIGYTVASGHQHQQGKTCTTCHTHLNGFLK